MRDKHDIQHYTNDPIRSFDHLFIFVPALNEVKTIAKTVNALQDSLSSLQIKTTLVVIDDASTDGTTQKLKALSSRSGLNDSPTHRLVMTIPDYFADHQKTIFPAKNMLIIGTIIAGGMFGVAWAAAYWLSKRYVGWLAMVLSLLTISKIILVGSTVSLSTGH